MLLLLLMNLDMLTPAVTYTRPGASGGAAWIDDAQRVASKPKKREFEGLREELQAAIVGLAKIPEAQPALADALEPFIDAPTPVIRVPDIDMAALMRHRDTVRFVIELYYAELHEARERDIEDEDVLLMLQ